jgi:hypothetical protein
VTALLETAGEQDAPVDAEEILAIEAGLAHLVQRADRFGFTRD